MSSVASRAGRVLAVTAGAIATLAVVLPAQAPSEAMVKAALIVKLTRFVGWPQRVLAEGQALVICVADHPAVLTALSSMPRSIVSADRPATIRAVEATEVDGCHVVFIGMNAAHIDTILRASLNRPMLTIGETSGFADRGGIVNLVRNGRHIGLEVNRDSLSRSQLTLSSLVLSLARTVFR